MEKREFLKRISLGTFTLPLLMGCNSTEEPNGKTSGTDSSDTSAECQLTNTETAGPYPTKSPSTLESMDITAGRTGVALDIEITVLNQTMGCLPLENAKVDIWHCDKDGNYSEYGNYASVSFLRGRQVTDSNGKVAFTSIFPGWYNGRSTHIHVHIYNESGNSLLVTQIAFPEGSDSAVNLVNASTANGYTKGMSGYTTNARDNVFSDGVSNELANISGSISSGFNLTHSIVVKA
ncbi:intradiol ring-cleavage dioxygenase [Algoriphagus sp. D3-2-R+10]|uniref:dioxygenase family protein n=1 Tax=Algoriphagus aurantiacus TaxID=3103948 RepID=UPI002B38FE84|nr:intradiol ring-cleavage dioxygenase [Algoriphagus sp. D3-2-R+10]MEB2774215.1 intradiol ring-cleavage dioxygenase [Algoriphagus sp. D3-2-R+10]